MEEVIKFFETHHKVCMDLSMMCMFTLNFLKDVYYLDSVAVDHLSMIDMHCRFAISCFHVLYSRFYLQGKYKVYNLCSERLYDASLFEGKVRGDLLLSLIF